MITELSVANYKSLQSLKLELGRITVLIGANGAGKSNILEALALASAAANDKLDNEFLATRGIRVTEDPRHMRSGFDIHGSSENIEITLETNSGHSVHYELTHDPDALYSSWKNMESSAVAFEKAKASFNQLEETLVPLSKRPKSTVIPIEGDDNVMTLGQIREIVKNYIHRLKNNGNPQT